MKKIIKTTLLIALMVSLSSCHLDQLPSDEIVNKDAFRTYQDATKFANGMTSYYRGTQYGRYAYANEVQGDMLNATNSFSNREGDIHTMSTLLTSSDRNLSAVWDGIYEGIKSVNNFLSNIDNVKPANATEKAAIKKFIGQAHYYRAAYYHALVRLYAKAYNSEEDGSSLAVPIVLTVDISVKPARATLKQVYAQIDEDITAARLNLAGTPGVVRAIEPTIDAVKALDARVKLDTRNYEQAHLIANELIASNTYALARTLPAMEAEWLNDSGTESIFQMYASLSEVANSNSLGYLSYEIGQGKYRPDYIPTQTCIDMYLTGDLRYQAWFGTFDCLLSNVPYSLVLLKKYQGNPAFDISSNRNYMHKPKVFTIAEMYLISAEAQAMSGNEAGAKVTLNELQAARGAYVSNGSMASIQKEWAKETIGQGLRISCLKRWNLGYEGRIPQVIDAIMQGSMFNGKVCTPGYNYFTWGMPNGDLQLNPNLKPQNPGW